jgi:MYXO-CTERM domain-containing protein
VSYKASAAEVHTLNGVAVTVSPTELTVAPGTTTELVVTLTLDPQALADPAADPVTPLTQTSLPRHFLDEADGHIVLEDDNGGAQSLVLPFYGIVRAASALTAAPAHGCMLESGEVASVTLVGDSAHPSPLVSVFELGGIDPVNLDIQPKEYDIVAFGVATDSAVKPRFDEATVHFAVAVEAEWTTPTRGGQSVVGIAIDADQDGTLDYSLRIEPLNPEEPFYDVLATTVYDLQEGGQIGSKRYVNMRPANEADTNPFFNSVIVLSAFAHDIGLTEDDTTFDYQAFSESGLGLVQLTELATFDVLAPRIDAARSAPDPGVPFYGRDDAIVAHLGARDAGGLLPPLLLLHHNGAQGARYETVAVSDYTFHAIGFNHTFATTMEAGDRPAGKIEITNGSEEVIHDVIVSGNVVGGAHALLAPSHGSCEDLPSVQCDVGSIPPGATRSITVQLAPNDAADSILLDLTMTTAAGCELPFETSIEIVENVKEPPPYDVGGGCGCSVPSGDDHHAWWLFGLGLLVTATRRRERLRWRSR